MRPIVALLLAAGLALATPSTAQVAAKTLQIYYIDTEGGQATLFVSPSGESLLVDTGNPGGRDTDRIMLAVQDAGVKQIDHLVLTHYHNDHVGGLAELAKRIPIKHFYDHGPSVEARGRDEFQAMYQQLYANARHTVSKPGDKIAFAGLDVAVVSSAGQVLKTNLPGAGRPNPRCASFVPKDLSGVFDPDNAQSVGFAHPSGDPSSPLTMLSGIVAADAHVLVGGDEIAPGLSYGIALERAERRRAGGETDAQSHSVAEGELKVGGVGG